MKTFKFFIINLSFVIVIVFQSSDENMWSFNQFYEESSFVLRHAKDAKKSKQSAKQKLMKNVKRCRRQKGCGLIQWWRPKRPPKRAIAFGK